MTQKYYLEKENAVFQFEVFAKNPRFVEVRLSTDGICIPRENFDKNLKLIDQEKGKIRKIIGLNLLENGQEQDKELFFYENTDRGNIFTLKIPLAKNAE